MISSKKISKKGLHRASVSVELAYVSLTFGVFLNLNPELKWSLLTSAWLKIQAFMIGDTGVPGKVFLLSLHTCADALEETSH